MEKEHPVSLYKDLSASTLEACESFRESALHCFKPQAVDGCSHVPCVIEKFGGLTDEQKQKGVTLEDYLFWLKRPLSYVQGAALGTEAAFLLENQRIRSFCFDGDMPENFKEEILKTALMGKDSAETAAQLERK